MKAAAKSQFVAEASLVEGPGGSCTLRPTFVTHLLRALPAKSQFFAEPTGRGAQWRLYVMPTFVTNCLQAQPGRGARRQLYLVTNVRNALAAGLARQIPIFR